MASKGAADQREREKGPASPGIKNWRGRPAHGFDLWEEGTLGRRRGLGARPEQRRGIKCGAAQIYRAERGRAKQIKQRGREGWFSLGAHVKLAAS
jgi:hypothetical protein